jgi:hypothetical protein
MVIITHAILQEWHIQAAIAEIGISLFDASAKGNSNRNDSAQKETALSGVLKESLHVSLEGVQIRTEIFAEEVSLVVCADVVQVLLLF